MIIDTDALRAAHEAASCKRCDAIEERYPIETCSQADQKRAIRQYTRIEQEAEEVDVLLARVEQLARETPGGETTERE